MPTPDEHYAQLQALLDKHAVTHTGRLARPWHQDELIARFLAGLTAGERANLIERINRALRYIQRQEPSA